ncbi:hypothetical protein N1851_025724 [Merluccius polli]|uniref:ZMYM2-like/QRICH1 C-terminal domain-containing protein n=1 Tax=Merluccius polli TaxID=89951 RepID=A0AA47NTM2_MERPO|nr:hypothetical protein N1851_025724 [Merluccius polli]
MSDFIISFNLFGEFDNFEDWDAAEEKERREYEKKKEKRHKEVTPEELNELEDDKYELNTKKTTKWASTKEGGEYSVASLRSLRASINRHLSDLNIISDPEFKTSNAVFKAILKRYIKSGKDTSFHHPRITELDLQIIRCSSALSPDTPVGLVRKVWFDIQLCFARRGRERSRELTMTSFIIQRDEHGVEYSLAHNPQTKNHKDPNEPHKDNLRGFMFARPGDPLCPVKSFKKNISKCPPDAKSLYLHPKRSITVASDVWYSREPMGVGLSRVYINHSLRSTAVGHLSDAGLETRQIMSVTGHCCESSLREWSNILSSLNVPSSGRSEPQTLNLRPSNATMMDMPISLSNFTINGNVAFNFK